jgi:hypothetical protein
MTQHGNQFAAQYFNVRKGIPDLPPDNGLHQRLFCEKAVNVVGQDGVCE